MSPYAKKALHWTGSALAMLGVLYVGFRLHSYSSQIHFDRFSVSMWLFLLAIGLGYGVANMMLAFAWRNLMLQLECNPTVRWAVKIYGLTQIAKYIPGNVFHLAGRQAMGMALGAPGWALVKSSAWELSLISVTAVFFSTLALPLFWAIPSLVTIVFFLLTLGVAGVGLRHYAGPSVARAFAWYVGFLAVCASFFGAVLLLVLVKDPRAASPSWLPLCGAYNLAWVAGLITPGAPAGLGVREMILLFVLRDAVPKPDLLLAVLLGRVLTVVGDTCFFLFSWLFRKEVSNSC